jgi:hypothetical protein
MAKSGNEATGAFEAWLSDLAAASDSDDAVDSRGTRRICGLVVPQGEHVVARIGDPQLLAQASPRLPQVSGGEGRRPIHPRITMRRTSAQEAISARLSGSPSSASAAVIFFAHESCELTGETFVCGGGLLMRLATVETKGIEHKSGGVSAEDIVANLDQIMDMTDATLMTIDRPT